MRATILHKAVNNDDEALLYYLFATKFHMKPSEVDALPVQVIEKLVFVDNTVRELEEREMKKVR